MKKTFSFLFVTLFLFGVSSVWGQTTIINYDFNNGTSDATLSPSLATGITSTFSSTESWQTYLGIASGSLAFTTNGTAGYARGMSNSGGTNTRYFLIQLGGTDLSSYSGYKIYFQAQRSATGAATITLAYSTDGTNFTDFGTTMSPGNGSFNEQVLDLTGVTAINSQNSLYFKLLVSGASGTGTLRIDNLQFQATNASLPVELTSFTSSVNENKVTLNWSTATEVNNYGFEILRSEVGRQQSAWHKVGFVQGSGNSNTPKNYTFTDEPMGGKEFQYRLKQIDFSGAFEYSGITTAVLENVSEFKLDQNFPNPFNPTTRISYTVPARSNVRLRVYDVLAKVVSELANGIHEAGHYEVTFDGSNLPSGAYFYKLEASNYVEVKKLLLIK